MLQQLYGDRTMKKSQVYDWHKAFPDGREIVYDLCSGHPSSQQIKQISSVCERL